MGLGITHISLICLKETKQDMISVTLSHYTQQALNLVCAHSEVIFIHEDFNISKHLSRWTQGVCPLMDFQLWNDFELAIFFLLFLPYGTGDNNNQSMDVEVAKIAIFWNTKNSYNQYIQSGFGRLFFKFSAPTGTHYLYLLIVFWLLKLLRS